MESAKERDIGNFAARLVSLARDRIYLLRSFPARVTLIVLFVIGLTQLSGRLDRKCKSHMGSFLKWSQTTWQDLISLDDSRTNPTLNIRNHLYLVPLKLKQRSN